MIVSVTTYQYRWCARCKTSWAARFSDYRCDGCNGETEMVDPHFLTWLGEFPAGRARRRHRFWESHLRPQPDKNGALTRMFLPSNGR